jgi:hypothetical protein
VRIAEDDNSSDKVENILTILRFTSFDTEKAKSLAMFSLIFLFPYLTGKGYLSYDRSAQVVDENERKSRSLFYMSNEAEHKLNDGVSGLSSCSQPSRANNATYHRYLYRAAGFQRPLVAPPKHELSQLARCRQLILR